LADLASFLLRHPAAVVVTVVLAEGAGAPAVVVSLEQRERLRALGCIGP
jgi:hypothetical protein